MGEGDAAVDVGGELLVLVRLFVVRLDATVGDGFSEIVRVAGGELSTGFAVACWGCRRRRGL